MNSRPGKTIANGDPGLGQTSFSLRQVVNVARHRRPAHGRLIIERAGAPLPQTELSTQPQE